MTAPDPHVPTDPLRTVWEIWRGRIDPIEQPGNAWWQIHRGTPFR